MRSLANYEAANKKLEQAKSKGKAVAEVRVFGNTSQKSVYSRGIDGFHGPATVGTKVV